MTTELEKKFPNITKWIKGDGWIEVGGSPHEGGMAKAFDEGGCILKVNLDTAPLMQSSRT